MAKATRAEGSPGRRRGMSLMRRLAAHPRVVFGLLVLVTVALSYPMLFWQPDETAAQSPVTEVTTTQELISERFADDVFDFLMLVEAESGDMLAKESLLSLLNNSAALRSDPDLGEYLVSYRHPDLGVEVEGIWTIADAVDRLLRGLGSPDGLAGADQAQVDAAVGAILEASEPIDWGMAVQTAQDEEGVWHTPALFVRVAADNNKLGGGGFLVTIGTASLDKEYFARDLRTVLEGDGDYLTVWAPAADVNLTSNEQGELAGPFIGLTIAAVLLIVGISFRSYWAVAISGAGLGILMVWLRGGANLAGLKSDQILSIILPISIISFGIDSAFHSIGRIRENQRKGEHGRSAFVIGVGSVLAALGLAATSDAVAFLSNTAAGIESIIQFGFAAAISTVAAFVLLGIATPLLLSVIEERTGEKTITRLGVGGDMVFSLLAAGLATATVLVLVFISAELGLALLVAYVLFALVVPYSLARRQRGSDAIQSGDGGGSRRLGSAVAAVASKPVATVGVATLITAASVWAALQLDVTFDVNDFFSPESDFVVALDKTTEYLGDQGGEPALVYVETDLTNPEALAAIRAFMQRVEETADNPLAVDTSGTVRVDPGVIQLVDLAENAVDLATPESLGSFYTDALSRGLPGASGNLAYTPNDVGAVLWKADDGSRYATVLTYNIPDTRNQENVDRSRGVLEPAATALADTLRVSDPDAKVVVTGSAIYRDDQLAGIRRALLLALPIAIFACLVVSVVFMRSLRYALVSVIPILLVVAWLYGIMYVAGYSINVVTSIIGAVSVGIGIDFSTHFTMRFLEERERGLRKLPALGAAGAGTGAALFGSALTSVAGFGILALAPMPMFASYGLLTALMIVLALVAALFVLPSLLSLVTRRDESARPSRVIDLRSGKDPVRFGIARDTSEAVVDDVIATFEREVRGGRIRIDTYPGPAVPGLVGDGTLDIGLMVRWPGSGVPPADLERLPLIKEEIVAVGNAERPDQQALALSDLGHCLLIAGPHAESEEGARRLVGSEVPYPTLAHTVPDVITGLQVAAITGGAMLLPRSMAPASGVLPVRPLEPRQWLETLLLISPDRAGDIELFDLVVRLSRAIDGDERLELDKSVHLDMG